jgi:hypothetical protein
MLITQKAERSGRQGVIDPQQALARIHLVALTRMDLLDDDALHVLPIVR